MPRVKGRDHTQQTAQNFKRYKTKPAKPPRGPLDFEIPEGFTLVVDSREQLPLFTRPPKGLTITTNTLPIGDYSIQGFETSVAIERKQLSDLISFVGKERNRTIEKLQWMKELDFAALVIEVDEDELIHAYEQTLRQELGLYSAEQVMIKSSHIRGFLISVNVKYGIHTYLERDRNEISRYILDRFIKYYNCKRKGEI